MKLDILIYKYKKDIEFINKKIVILEKDRRYYIEDIAKLSGRLNTLLEVINDLKIINKEA